MYAKKLTLKMAKMVTHIFAGVPHCAVKLFFKTKSPDEIIFNIVGCHMAKRLRVSNSSSGG